MPQVPISKTLTSTTGPNDPSRVMFVYWGRRGLTRFTLQLARACLADPAVAATISVSRQSEGFPEFEGLGADLLPVTTYVSNIGAVTEAWRIPEARRLIAQRIRSAKIATVIDLMPHAWAPFVAPAIRAAGARRAVIAHDADVHPGDYRSGFVKSVTDRAVFSADRILTLSRPVTERLVERGVAAGRLRTLFHPDLDAGPASPVPPTPRPGEPLRLTFLGRIMPYKGLPLFLDTIEALRRDGIAVAPGIFGEGALGTLRPRIEALGIDLENRWLSSEEIAAVLGRSHAVVLSHVEASQSGIAAMALGAGVPVVATPVGGLVEQVQDGLTGVLAHAVEARALADAVKRLLLDARLFDTVAAFIRATAGERSMARFVRECIAATASD